MKITRECWKCEYADCGHEWLVAGEAPEKCAKCRRRGWNKEGARTVLVGEPSPEESERERRREKKAVRHAQLKQDCLEALPDVIPPKMREKLATRPLDHHPACHCLRCRPPLKAIQA